MAMAGKGDEDDDVGEDALAKKGAELFEKRIRRIPNDDDDDEIPEVVEIHEPEDDDEVDEIPKGQTQKDKRSARGSARASARERAAAAEAEAKVLREQLEAERSSPRGATQQQGPNPTQHALGNIDRQIRANYEAIEANEEAYQSAWKNSGGKLSAEDRAKFRDRAIDLDVQNKTLVYDRAEAIRAPERERAARDASLRARAPDVYDNPKALEYMRATYNKEVLSGHKDSLELFERCAEETRQVILGKRPAPDRSARQRSSGMRGGPAPAVAPTSPGTINMPKGGMYDRVARAAYPDLDPAAARQKWANGPGKKILLKQG
jgi:hypothetical protein